MREFYYHKRDEEGKPRLTVCLLKDESANKVVSKGISICSFCDNPKKDDGRDKAKRRALASLCAERDLFPVKRLEAFIIIDACFARDEKIRFKGQFNPILTPQEKRITEKTKPIISDTEKSV